MVDNNYTKTECAEAMIEADKKCDGKLSQSKYNRLGMSPSYQTISRTFGGWNKAKVELGLDVNMGPKMGSPPKIIDMTQEEWENASKRIRFRRRMQSKVARIKLNEGCKKCGYDKHPSALTFHHKYPTKKEEDVCFMVQKGLGKDRILEEIKKCEILCSNCHRELENSDVYTV